MHVFHPYSDWSEPISFKHLMKDSWGDLVEPRTWLDGMYQRKTCKQCGKIKNRLIL